MQRRKGNQLCFDVIKTLQELAVDIFPIPTLHYSDPRFRGERNVDRNHIAIGKVKYRRILGIASFFKAFFFWGGGGK